MKKLITILLLMMATCVQAQHLKFMNIPLNGTIDNFQAKLAAKGITPNKEYNAVSAVGNRAFKGVFCGYSADIHSYYNPKTKIVYRCKACISDTNEDRIMRIYSEIKDMLDEKYEDCCTKDGEQDSYDTYSILVLKDGIYECDWDESVGTIGLYISEYMTNYTLHIDYTDRENFDENQALNSNDL